jgi:hypothetical protein
VDFQRGRRHCDCLSLASSRPSVPSWSLADFESSEPSIYTRCLLSAEALALLPSVLLHSPLVLFERPTIFNGFDFAAIVLTAEFL